MNTANSIEITSLIVASGLVLLTLFLSYWQRLKLERDILIGMIRAVCQLIVVGYLLSYIFDVDSYIFTTLLLLFMILNAAYNSAHRGKEIRNGFFISVIAITTGSGITLAVLILSGIISYHPAQIVPVSGMIIGNSMVALGLCYRAMLRDFELKREEVETKLALGADILPSSIEIIRASIRTGMIPTIDSAKTLGVVSLPGMMTGLILAGTSPMEAIKYQIMVTFMLLSTTAISSLIACYLAYRYFFNSNKQLL
ncbi:MAG: ABC transporter permease [Lachnospiraceae bacterium]